MADALGTGGSPSPVSAIDHRLALAGLVCTSSSTALATRLGVMAGPGSTTLITGTSATGTMTVNIAAHHWVTTRGTADGIYLGTKETSSTVNIAAAPGANSRIDLIYVKQNDSSSTISADGSMGEEYGVVTGTAAASPVKPALPLGAVELGTVTVATGATNTLGAGITIANTALQVVARGGITPVRNTTERDAITAYPAAVHRLDNNTIESHGLTGSWAQPQTADKPWTEIVGSGGTAYSFALPAGATFGTLTSMSTSVVVPTGRTLDVEWKAPSVQAAASTNADIQLLIGGAVADGGQWSTAAAPVFTPGRLTGSVVGTGASVTLVVQGRAATGSATVIGGGAGSVKLRYRIW